MTQPFQGRPPEFVPKLVIALSEGYGLSRFGRDLLAGLAVAIIAVPLGLAIAISSGATPAQGLLTVVIGGFFISLLGGSRTQIGGPTAAFIVTVYGVIHEHGYDGLILATLMAGIILFAAALMRVGTLVRYVPEPVIRGFTVGIAVVIVVSQIKDVFGLSGVEVPSEVYDKLHVLWEMRGSFTPEALLVALGSLAIILAIRMWNTRFPGLVIAVVVAAVVVEVFHLPVDTIASRFGPLDFALQPPHLPALSYAKVIDLLPSALVIAFLAGIESLLSAMVADKMTGSNHRSNTEILGQGVANIASALMGGLPGHGRHRPHRDQYPRWRHHTGGRAEPRRLRFAVSHLRVAADRLSAAAGTCFGSVDRCLDDERAAQADRRPRTQWPQRHGDPVDAGPDRFCRSDAGHRPRDHRLAGLPLPTPRGAATRLGRARGVSLLSSHVRSRKTGFQLSCT